MSRAVSDLTAAVITASDRSAAGERPDASGELIASRLVELGFRVERSVVPDDRERIERALTEAAAAHRLVITTGGTGLTARDVTPQATAAVIDYEVQGLAEAMRAEGRLHTPMAILSRSMAGVRGRTLIVNLPGSPKGALESFEAISGVLHHAIETLAGPYDHAGWAETALEESTPEVSTPETPSLDPADPEGSAHP
jgi:molybdenum cofactor synthesis domain-containing protein